MKLLIDIDENTYKKVKDIVAYADVDRANSITQNVCRGIANGIIISGDEIKDNKKFTSVEREYPDVGFYIDTDKEKA